MMTTFELFRALTRPIEPVGNLISIPPTRTEPGLHAFGRGRHDAEVFYAFLLKADKERKFFRANGVRPGNRWRLGCQEIASRHQL